MNKKTISFSIQSKIFLFFIFNILIFSPLNLFSRQVETFYGLIEVKEPVLLELIDSKPIQRLKEVNQYGVAYYVTKYNEKYTRYKHSLGVFAILRKHGASLKEQIAGLLHDVSHTVFSHVGDWIFEKQNQETDYQNTILKQFLHDRGIEKILTKYGINTDEILPLAHLFPALECPLPDLCADRIDYNIQGAYYQKFISYEEALEIFNTLRFTNNVWIASNAELIKKITNFSFFMTQSCWGGPSCFLMSQWLADAIKRGVELGDISYEDIHFGTDQEIWNKLNSHPDKIIQEKMLLLKKPEDYYVYNAT